MFWSIYLLICCTILLLLFYYFYRRPKGYPPGPRGLPLLGAILSLGKWPEREINNWSKSYGPVMSVRMGREDWVILSDLESIHQALVVQATKFSGRIVYSGFDGIYAPLGLGNIDYGELWKSQRKFGLMTLRGFGVGRKSMENRVVEEASYINDFIRSKIGKAFDILDILHKAVSNNICSVLVGKRFEYDNKKFGDILHALNRKNSASMRTYVLKLVLLAPKLKHIPPISMVMNSFKKDHELIMDLIQELIDEHQETFDENDLRDFIDAFLKEMKVGKDKAFTNEQLRYYMLDLFEAGTDTSTNTLYWALLCLLHYPEVQHKLRQEIVEIIGPSGSVSMSHRPNMPYTNAFIQELMRYRTLAPLSVPHKTNEDSELYGYIIPKNTTILTNLWAVHNNPSFWNEPGKFKPERFINEKGNFVKSDHVIPFSVGPRFCLGEQLARMEIFMYLVSMVQQFEFLPDPDASTLPVIDDGANGFVYAAHPYKLVAREL